MSTPLSLPVHVSAFHASTVHEVSDAVEDNSCIEFTTGTKFLSRTFDLSLTVSCMCSAQEFGTIGVHRVHVLFWRCAVTSLLYVHLF